MRTTAAEVKELLDNSTLSDPIINAFIKSANIFVTNSLPDSGLDDSTMADIERWVAAHLISYTRERQSTQEAAGSASISYAGNFSGVGLLATSYGQMACTLDTTGTLFSIAQTKKQIKIQSL